MKSTEHWNFRFNGFKLPTANLERNLCETESKGPLLIAVLHGASAIETDNYDCTMIVVHPIGFGHKKYFMTRKNSMIVKIGVVSITWKFLVALPHIYDSYSLFGCF